MRRFLRILLDGATVLSFLMCVGTIVLWVRSYWVGEFVRYSDGASGISYSIRAEADGILVEKYWAKVTTQVPAGWWHFSLVRGPVLAFPGARPYDPASRGIWSMPRVDTTTRPSWPAFGPVNLWWSANLPFWSLAAVTGIAPTIRLCRWLLRRRRTGIGLCRACGYDLRATPDRCPECGAVPRAE